MYDKLIDIHFYISKPKEYTSRSLHKRKPPLSKHAFIEIVDTTKADLKHASWCTALNALHLNISHRLYLSSFYIECC